MARIETVGLELTFINYQLFIVKVEYKKLPRSKPRRLENKYKFVFKF